MENPADTGTRPAYLKDITSDLWLHGPPYLSTPNIPENKIDFSKKVSAEEKRAEAKHALTSFAAVTKTQRKKQQQNKRKKQKPKTNTTMTEEAEAKAASIALWEKIKRVKKKLPPKPVPILEHYSSFDTAVERRAIILWIIHRWMYKTAVGKPNGNLAKHRSASNTPFPDAPRLTSEKERQLPVPQQFKELAARHYIKAMQKDYLQAELASLRKAKSQNLPPTVPAKSKLVGLTPMLDEHDVIRLQGRLQYSSLKSGQKHPVVIHQDSLLAQLIIRKYHEGNAHAIATVTSRVLRLDGWWLLSPTRTVKSYIQKCITCQKVNRLPAVQTLGSFKAERYQTSSNHNTLIIDYSGKFVLRQIPDNDTGTSKFIDCYIIIYVQLNTRFMYLDLVADMSAQTFLDSFRSYCDQYGSPKICMTDGALYFESAAKTLAEQHDKAETLPPACDEIKRKTTQRWFFNHAHAPHKGADWERNLKTAKQLLNKCLRPLNTIERKSKNFWPVNFMNMRHILTSIAAVMNSRPLVATDKSEDDMHNYITPAKLVLGHDTLPPALGYEQCAETLTPDIREMYAQRVRIIEDFWRQFMDSYVPELQRAGRWEQPSINLREGQLVLIQPTYRIGLKRPYWKMARVVKTNRDRKQLVRTVHVYLPTRHTTGGKRIKNTIRAVPVGHVIPLELEATGMHHSKEDIPLNEWKTE